MRLYREVEAWRWELVCTEARRDSYIPRKMTVEPVFGRNQRSARTPQVPATRPAKRAMRMETDVCDLQSVETLPQFGQPTSSLSDLVLEASFFY